MTTIRHYDITKGTKLAITLKNGTRIAGRAISGIQEGRGVEWHITVRQVVTNRLVRVEGDEVETLQTW